MTTPIFEDFQNGFRVTVFNESFLNKENVGVKTLLVFIENNPGTNVLTMEKHFNVTQRTIERWMQLLREENKIEFKGVPKTGGYHRIIG